MVSQREQTLRTFPLCEEIKNEKTRICLAKTRRTGRGIPPYIIYNTYMVKVLFPTMWEL